MSKIIGLHGIITNGNKNIGNLLTDLKNKSYHPSYRIYPMLGYFKSYRDFYVNKILEVFNDGDHIIAHSAGCTIVYWLLQHLQHCNMKAGKIFFINAALDRRIVFPENTYEKIINFCEDDDIVLRLSQLLPKHPFGEMGRIGYCGPSSNIENKKDIAEFDDSFMFHGSYFKEPARSKLIEIINDEIK